MIVWLRPSRDARQRHLRAAAILLAHALAILALLAGVALTGA